MGLYDPDGLLFKEIMTWVEDLKLESKEMIRAQCQQKLEAIFLQVWWAKGWRFTYWKPIAFFRGLLEDHEWFPGFLKSEHLLRAPYTAEGCT